MSNLYPVRALALLAVLTATGGVQAQNHPREKLGSMVGSWDVVYEMAPGPTGKGGRGNGTMTARLGPSDDSLILDFTSTSGPTAGFKIHQVIAWNPDRRSYDIAWVDSYSPGIVAVEGQTEGGEIVYRRETVRGDVRMVTKGVVSVVRSDAFTITSYLSLDGGPDVKTMRLRYERSSAAP